MAKHKTTPIYAAETIEAHADKLTEQHRAILMLATAGDYRSITHTLEIPIGTVKSRLNRARAALAAILAETASPPQDPGASP